MSSLKATRVDLDNFFSLYDTDNDVTLYDCLEDAEIAKRIMSRIVNVEGPFEHQRVEKGLILAARSALDLFTRLDSEIRSAVIWEELLAVKRQLEDGLSEFEATPDIEWDYEEDEEEDEEDQTKSTATARTVAANA